MRKFKKLTMTLLLAGVLVMATGCSCSTDNVVETGTTGDNNVIDNNATDKNNNNNSVDDSNVNNNVDDNANDNINNNANDNNNGTTEDKGLVDDIGADIKDGINAIERDVNR